MVFDGRVAEDFKLKTGTWVNVGPLHIIASDAMSSLAKNILICGVDQDEVGMIVFPEIEVCRKKAGLSLDLPFDKLIQSPEVRALFQERLDSLNKQGTGSSSRIARLVIASSPLTDVEITDKNTLSRNVVIDLRKAEIDDMYSSEPSYRVFLASARQRQGAAHP
jgi:feruloyl-CoA synthase